MIRERHPQPEPIPANLTPMIDVTFLLIVFFLVCLGVSTLFYLGVHQLKRADLLFLFPVFFVFNQTINYHHYVVDGLIWKVRKRSLQMNLGLATES